MHQGGSGLKLNDDPSLMNLSKSSPKMINIDDQIPQIAETIKFPDINSLN